MSKVELNTLLDIEPEKVWELIGHFKALPDWHPAVESSELEDGGAQRRLQLVGGSSIVERLEHVGDGEFDYSYAMEDSPIPVADYKATVRLIKVGKKTKVVWESDFDGNFPAADFLKLSQGLYQGWLEDLKKMFGG
ncbi:MAG: SRPBCC family protein [Rhodospirillales bacterium]|nr:SRPBCC family protein [Rhodospirillales bacterium]